MMDYIKSNPQAQKPRCAPEPARVMSAVTDCPHIPQGDVCLCAIGAGHLYIKDALECLGIEVVELTPSALLPGPVANHADMLLHHLGGNKLLIGMPDAAAQHKLERYGFAISVAGKPPGGKYPDDIALNCFALDGWVFGSAAHIAPEILSEYRQMGIRAADVAQGYAKCSIAIVDNRSIITSDPSIAAAAEERGIAVLRISPGNISLPGYGHGFIGGCCGLISRGALAFAGDLTSHPDFARIRQFCSERGVEIVSLHHGPLTDIGGILPLAAGHYSKPHAYPVGNGL